MKDKEESAVTVASKEKISKLQINQSLLGNKYFTKEQISALPLRRTSIERGVNPQIRHKLEVSYYNVRVQGVINILNKPTRGKNEEDVKELMPFLKQIKFFQERTSIKDSDYPEIISSINYEFMQAGKEVFHYDQPGDKFYIILLGSVKVILPNPDMPDFLNRYATFKAK